MKRIFFVTALMIVFAQLCFAATSTLNRSDADSQARQSFELRAVDGKIFDVRIVGDDEKLVTDWFRAPEDTIYAGDYSAYLTAANSDTFSRQDVELFADDHDKNYPQRINVTRDNHDGFYFVRGVNNLPDLLVSKIQITSFAFAVKIFVVKDGRLQLVKFQNDKGTLQDSRDSDFRPMTYLDDGTISLTWHTNTVPDVGTYATVYMLDADNLILIPAYTKNIWSPQ